MFILMMFTIQDLLLKLPRISKINRYSSLTTFLKTSLVNLKYSYVFFFLLDVLFISHDIFW